MKNPEIIQNLIELFAKLPGIGPKTAERFVYYFLKQPKQFSYTFAAAINTLANSITNCETCHCISQTNPCLTCADTRREQSAICIVAETHDMHSIENTGQFFGRYHILNGVLDPLHGVTPSQLTIDHLVRRIQEDKNIKEVILAFSPDMEGEATILYLKKLLAPLGMSITRLATGLPTGADLEYADSMTLSKALSGRTKA